MKPCVKVDGELSDCFAFEVRVRQACAMPPWMFNIFLDGYMREIEAKVGKIGARLKLNGVDWSVTVCLFVDDTVLMAEKERELFF